MSKVRIVLTIFLAFSRIFAGGTKNHGASRAIKTQKTQRTGGAQIVNGDKKKNDIAQKRLQIKRRAHDRGYFLQSEMDYFLATPNPMDLCSEVKKHGKNRLKIGKEISQRFSRPLNEGELDSTTVKSTPVTVETVIYTGKNFRNCLIEAYFLRLFTKIGKRTVSSQRCYLSRGSNTEEDPTKLFFVYSDRQKDLHSFLKESVAVGKEFSEKELANFLRNIAESLNDLHKMKIVHRNVSLQSFLIDSQNRVRISYFQHSRYLKYSGSDGRKTFEGQELYESEYLSYPNDNEVNRKSGAPFYKSPEFIRKSQEGLPTDIFALGVTMASLTSSKLPRHFMPATEEEALNYIVPTLPEKYGKYQALISSMMDRNYKKRPTADAIVKSLQAIDSQYYPSVNSHFSQQQKESVSQVEQEDSISRQDANKKHLRIMI